MASAPKFIKVPNPDYKPTKAGFKASQYVNELNKANALKGTGVRQYQYTPKAPPKPSLATKLFSKVTADAPRAKPMRYSKEPLRAYSVAPRRLSTEDYARLHDARLRENNVRANYRAGDMERAAKAYEMRLRGKRA